MLRRSFWILSCYYRMMSSHAASSERVQDLARNYKTIQEQVKKAAASSARTPTLVLVSKLKPPSDILAIHQNLPEEAKHFGENYVQELVDKAKELPSDIKWHFIGGLQSNKCKVLAAIPNLYVVETLDSAKKADLLEKALSGHSDASRKLNVYLQVNTSGEDSKSGIPPITDTSQDENNIETLAGLARHIIDKCPHLNILGLMTIGALQSSFQAKAGEENPDFICLRDSRDRLQKILGIDGLELSMGMSNDFVAAIESGSNNVRVGSSIFGERPSKEQAKQQREDEKQEQT